jgi:hypothetical protein
MYKSIVSQLIDTDMTLARGQSKGYDPVLG